MNNSLVVTLPQETLEAIDEIAALAGTSREVVARVHLAQHFRKRPAVQRMEAVVIQDRPQPRSDGPALPQTGFLRARQVLELIPISRSTWLAGVADGRFPRPYKVGRSTVWRVEEIRGLIEQLGRR